jgi:hypothetical protein
MEDYAKIDAKKYSIEKALDICRLDTTPISSKKVIDMAKEFYDYITE